MTRFIKKCKDCIYFVKSIIKEESLCYRFGKMETFEFYRADESRKDEKKCGKEGRYFMSNLIK